MKAKRLRAVWRMVRELVAEGTPEQIERIPGRHVNLGLTDLSTACNGPALAIHSPRPMEETDDRDRHAQTPPPRREYEGVCGILCELISWSDRVARRNALPPEGGRPGWRKTPTTTRTTPLMWTCRPSSC